MIQSLENIKKSVSEFPFLLCDLKEYLDNRCTHFRAGCITESISNLQMMTLMTFTSKGEHTIYVSLT